jgi:hypothetical protein
MRLKPQKEEERSPSHSKNDRIMYAREVLNEVSSYKPHSIENLLEKRSLYGVLFSWYLRAHSGHTITSLTISVPLPPGSSCLTSLPFLLKMCASFRGGYVAFLVSTTRRVAGVEGGTILLHISHINISYSRHKKPFGGLMSEI